MLPASFQILSRPRQEQEPFFFFPIFQGTDKVIRHLKKLPIVGEAGLGHLGYWCGALSSWVGFPPPVLSGMTSHSGARLSRLALWNILPMLEAGSLGSDPCSAAP